jgi:hypothetical protein
LKFGPLAPEFEDRVRSADPDRLLEWGERISTAESLQDVLGTDLGWPGPSRKRSGSTTATAIISREGPRAFLPQDDEGLRSIFTNEDDEREEL